MENLKELMQGLVEVYNTYLHKTKKIVWQSDEQKATLQQVVDTILPGSTVDMNCDVCVTNALAVILCRYEAMFQIEEAPKKTPRKKKKP